MVQVFYFYLRADWYQYRVSHFTDGKTEYSEVVAFRAGKSASDSIQRMVSHSSDRHHLPSADTHLPSPPLIPRHSWRWAQSQGADHLPSFQSVQPCKCFLQFKFLLFLFVLLWAIGCIFPASLILFIPGNITSPWRFCTLFCYPWCGCHSTELWKRSVLGSLVGVASSAAEGSWLHSRLWQQHPARLLLFIQAIAVFASPGLRSSSQCVTFFSALLLVLPPLSWIFPPIVLLAMWVCQRKLAVVLLSMALAQRWCHLTEWRLFNG